jgi:hypothetical protein
MSGFTIDSRTLIGVADAEYGTVVEPDATLVREYGDPPTNVIEFDGKAMAVVPGHALDYGATTFAFGDPPVAVRELAPRQRLLEGGVPIVATEFEVLGAEGRIDAFAWAVDERLVDIVRIGLRNPSTAPLRVSAWVGQRGHRRTLDRLRDYPRLGDAGWRGDELVLDDRLYVLSRPAPDAAGVSDPPPEAVERRIDELAARLAEQGVDRLESELADFESELDAGGFEHAARYDLELAPGGEAQVWLLLPVHPVHTQAEIAALRALDPERCLQQCVASWRELLAGAAEIELPDQRLHDLYRTSVANLLLLRRRVGEHYVLSPGKGPYRRFWMRDAAYMAWSLDLAGLHTDARRGLEYMLHLQGNPEERWAYAGVPPLHPIAPEKSFECPMGQWDGQGQAPWAIVEHYRLTGDRDWLERAYPHLLAVGEWIREARALLREPRYHEQVPVPGLLPPSIGEGWSNEPDYYLVHQLWALHGLRRVREAAAALGREDDVAWLDAEYHDFRGALLAAIDRAYVVEDGVARLASALAPERDVNATLTQQHIAFLAWPEQVLDEGDARMDALFDGYEQWFAPEGLLGFRAHPNRHLALREALHRRGAYVAAGAWPVRLRWNWSYGTCEIARADLELGRTAQAAAIFERFAEQATSTGNWVEMVDLDARRGQGDQPHGWAAANYVSLLRMLLAREDGDTLRLLEGIPAAWREAGSRIAVRRLPTYFGLVGVRCEISADGAEATIEIEGEQLSAKRIVVHLGVPATVLGGGVCAEAPDGAVEVPVGTTEIRAQLARTPV